MSSFRARTVAVAGLLLVLVICLIYKTHLDTSDLDTTSQSHRNNREITTRQKQNGTIHRFVSDLRQGQVDLIILIERSKSVGRYNFYSQSRKLVSHVLRYYTKVDPEYVRVVVATFAIDFKVHFDGITNNISKCDIWDTYWDQVVLNDTTEIWDSTNVSFAIQQTETLFLTSSVKNRSRYLWVICKKKTGLKISHGFSKALNNNFTLLLTSVGSGGNTGGIPHDQHVYDTGDVPTTVADIENHRPLPRLANPNTVNNIQFCDADGYILDSCPACPKDHACASGSEECVCISNNTTYTCPTTDPADTHNGYCAWNSGRHGPHCEHRDKHCLPAACANNGTCVEDVRGYWCKCPAGFDIATYCETKGGVSFPVWAIGVIILILVIIIVLCVVCCCIFWRRRRDIDIIPPPTSRWPRTEESRPVRSPPETGASLSQPSETSRDRILQRLQKSEELKGFLADWLNRFDYASGIDVEDKKLTIFCPKGEEEAVLLSLTTELRTVLGTRYNDFLDFFKIKPYTMFLISRQQSKIGSGSHIYHLNQRGQPLYVTLGAIFKDLIGNDLYCLTTSHMEDAKGKTFYFSSNSLRTELGMCVAYIQQSNPLLEACLIKMDKAAHDQCSSLLLPERLQAPVAFRGPYTGPISELLAAPQEVMLCGGQTDLTRGRMKYYAFDFSDPDTSYKVYGGIVTLPIHPGDFVTAGDSGATISIASSQSFLVRDWCLGGRSTGTSVKRDALPYTSHDEAEGPSTNENVGVSHPIENQVVPESNQNLASSPPEGSRREVQQDLSAGFYLRENIQGTDQELTALKTVNDKVYFSDHQDDFVTIKIFPEHGAVFQDREKARTIVKTVCSRHSSISSAEDVIPEQGQTRLKQVQTQALGDDSIEEQTLLKTTSASVRSNISPKEVMTHEAISTHCFSVRIEYEDEPPEYGSISFRMDIAVEKLQEQIDAELRLVPILMMDA